MGTEGAPSPCLDSRAQSSAEKGADRSVSADGLRVVGNIHSEGCLRVWQNSERGRARWEDLTGAWGWSSAATRERAAPGQSSKAETGEHPGNLALPA